MSEPCHDQRLLGDRDVDGVPVRDVGDREVGRSAGACADRLGVRVAEVVAVGVADEDDVDLAEPRVGGADDRATRVVEEARAVRVLEDEGAVLGAELAVEAAERRHLDGLGERGRGERRGQRG
jgi:hypothetical protein